MLWLILTEVNAHPSPSVAGWKRKKRKQNPDRNSSNNKSKIPLKVISEMFRNDWASDDWGPEREVIMKPRTTPN